MLRRIEKVPLLRLLRVSAVLVLAARPAMAEVMDKELSRSDIDHVLVLSVAVAMVAAAVHRWLLLPLFVLGPVQEVGFAWTEWHDPIVGRAMSEEDGSAYGLVANGAMTAAVAAHLILWIFSSRFRHRDCSASRHVFFAMGIFLAVLFHAALGFSFTWRSVVSAPTLLAGAVVLVTGHLWRRERLVAVPE